MLLNGHAVEKKINVKLSGSFGDTSYGKGPVNGIRTKLKRQAMEKALTCKLIINKADEPYQAVRNGNIKVTIISITELQKYLSKYLETLSIKSMTIPEITGFHFVDLDVFVALDTEENIDTEKT